MYLTSGRLWRRFGLAAVLVLAVGGGPAEPLDASASVQPHEPLKRAKVFLAAGDYRRAIEACQREVDEAPSAASYVYLTYVYQALGGYLDALAKDDKWVMVEQVYLNLAAQDTRDITDPPDVLARIAKEILSESLQRQSDIAAAMATRLDRAETERLWQEQAAWRKAHPESWWSGVPDSWKW